MSGSSRLFIIDEWMWHDLSGENGVEKQRETLRFLELLYNKCDKIATIKSSRFEEKFFDFLKSAEDIISREIAKFYKYNIFYNSEKYLREEETQTVSENTLSEIKLDDRYLAKLYYIVKRQHKIECLIITTDEPLINVLTKHKIQCEHRDSFLHRYISEKEGDK